MKPPQPSPVVINGWTLFAHELFLQQLESLALQVRHLQSKDPDGYRNKNASKRLAAITKLAFEIIPQDPPVPNTDKAAHWASNISIGLGQSFSNNTGSFSVTIRTAKSSFTHG